MSCARNTNDQICHFGYVLQSETFVYIEEKNVETVCMMYVAWLHLAIFYTHPDKFTKIQWI